MPIPHNLTREQGERIIALLEMLVHQSHWPMQGSKNPKCPVCIRLQEERDALREEEMSHMNPGMSWKGNA